MKLLSETVNVQRFGGGVEKKITMKIGPKAFQVLSDHLYSRKIEAIVREYSSNAWDSHIAAGKTDVPFEIHLPTTLEPWFSIKDFGIGLSLAGAENMMIYFESLKEDTNDLTGTFGLGSKAGFAYTKNFTIETRWNGEKYIVSCFINDDNEPGTRCLNEDPIPTDECNGIEIKIAVKPEDFGAFRDAVVKVLRYFPVKPIITAGGPVVYPAPEIVVSGDGWRIVESAERTIKALQGNVAYPLSSTDVNLEGLGQFAMEIDFPMGDICPSPNRETISYNKPTVENINKRLDKIRDELIGQIQKEVSKEQNLWDATIKAQKVLHDLGVSGSVKESLFNRLRWKKTELPTSFSITDFEKEYICDQYVVKWGSNKYRLDTSHYSRTTKFLISDKIRICYNDADVGRISARLNCRYEGSSVEIILVFGPNIQDPTKSASQQKLSKALFGVNIQPMSSLNLPKRKPNAKKTEKGKGIVRVVYRDGKKCGLDEEIFLDNGGFFVNVNRVSKVEEQFFSSTRFVNFVDDLIKTGVVDKDVVIYGLKRAMREKVSKKYPGKWINFVEHASKQASDLFKSGAFDKELRVGQLIGQFTFDLDNADRAFKEFGGNFNFPKDVHELFNVVTNLRDIIKSKRLEMIENLMSACRVQYTVPPNIQCQDKIQKVLDKYPLLTLLFDNFSSYSSNRNKETMERVAQYVNDLDELSSFRAIQNSIPKQDAA